jgi:hypothetical protein
MKLLYYFTFLIAFTASAQQKTQPTLDYYLPQNVSYNKNIPTQKSVFNFELGEMHTDHTQLANYMKEVAKVSDRIAIVLSTRSKIAFTTVNDFSPKTWHVSRKLTSNTSLI